MVLKCSWRKRLTSLPDVQQLRHPAIALPPCVGRQETEPPSRSPVGVAAQVGPGGILLGLEQEGVVLSTHPE
jgi:hypothetical protein